MPEDSYEYEKRASVTLASPATRGSQLPLAEQGSAIESLHVALNSLEDKLSAVLSPNNPTAEGESEPQRDGSPLFHQLSGNNSSIYAATRRVVNLVDRIEC
jgi:hypothetical protein